MSAVELQQPADTGGANSVSANQKLERLYKSCYVRLGGASIRVELEDIDYDTAWDIGVRTYRSLSTKSVYKTMAFMVLEKGKQIYTLPDSIDNVMKIVRTGSGFGTGAGAEFDPWNAATANLILRDARPTSGFMGLATYDLFVQFTETIDRLFATELNFLYRPENQTLVIYQIPKGAEKIMLECSVLKSFDELLADHFARKWLEDYTLANLKIILGRKYGKFASLPGAQGGVSLGGAALIQEGQQEIEKLEKDILDFADGGDIPLPIMG